jgi:hypothetical protein
MLPDPQDDERWPLKKQIFRLIVTFPTTLPKIKLLVLLKIKIQAAVDKGRCCLKV